MQPVEEGGTKGQNLEIERPELLADGLPEDPEPTEEEKEAKEKEDAAGDADNKKSDDAGNNKDDKQEKKAGEDGAEKAPFEFLDTMKGRLLRFTLEEGEMETLPTGRKLKDSFPQDSGVMYVDQVCVSWSCHYHSLHNSRWCNRIAHWSCMPWNIFHG